MKAVYITLFFMLIVFMIIVVFTPYKYEYFEDGVQQESPTPAPENNSTSNQVQAKKSKAEECEDRYKDLQKKKEAEDTTLREKQADIDKKQSLIDAAKDAEWKDKISKTDALVKQAMAQQKEAEDKLAEINDKKAACEGKLTAVDPSIKSARDCCDKEGEALEKAQQEAAIAIQKANELTAVNNILTSEAAVFDAQIKKFQPVLDSCNKSLNDLRSQNASLRAQL